MGYAIGIALALAAAGFAALVGFDRDRAFYPDDAAGDRFVQAWWPAFCLGYDVTAGCAMLWLLRHRSASAKEPWQTRI